MQPPHSELIRSSREAGGDLIANVGTNLALHKRTEDRLSIERREKGRRAEVVRAVVEICGS
jgi:hypothetical protein